MLTGMHRDEVVEEVHGWEAVSAEAMSFLCITTKFLGAKGVSVESATDGKDERFSYWTDLCNSSVDVQEPGMCLDNREDHLPVV